MPTWKLAETNYAHVKEHRYEVAVLPLGATEPHNLHLPYGMDHFEGSIIGEAICQAAFERGANVVLLPTIPYGTQTNMRQLPLAMNLNPSTLTLVVTDLVESLALAGIRKVLLLNSHGGNEVKTILRELAGKTAAHLFLCDWYNSFRDRYQEIFAAAGGPRRRDGNLVCPGLFPGTGGSARRRFSAGGRGPDPAVAIRRDAQGWVSITRPWHLLTTNAGSGNPQAATAEKGRQMMEVVVDRLSTFLVELSAAEIDEWFPFQPL